MFWSLSPLTEDFAELCTVPSSRRPRKSLATQETRIFESSPSETSPELDYNVFLPSTLWFPETKSDLPHQPSPMLPSPPRLSSTLDSILRLEPSSSTDSSVLFDISIRLKSVENIQKITKSMKMVAKYAKAERDLKGARAYGVGAKAFFDNIDPVAADQAAPTAETKKQVLVLITSDRGLCGAVHSSIVKEAKKILSDAGDKDIRVVAIGDKSRAGLQRVFVSRRLISVQLHQGHSCPSGVG
ncbi:hypothetical protein B9Z55_016064 [Caenorhabditis nigoni]|uniref:ATP synthase subunit gamma, mitochondrial n=1 Tax=Caenorhabditis nigoni TaxID=1611254 RepID=A0A2G5UD13_9PELO|nr:hypothetical protein B9Z55_016064 [Caenorhabditis nigoni]